MPISPEDAGAEVQRFIVGLNASKHSAREKAIRSFRLFVEKQGMEFYDDDVDSLLLGDGYTLGLMQWCGESSTGTQGALKRTAAPAIALLKWLVSLRDPSGDENIFLGRFLQVALEDLRKMKLELHLLISQKGNKVSSRGGKSEEACEIVSLVLQQHRNDAGEVEEISLEELLPGEEAGKVFMHWLQQTAMGKQNTLRLNSQSREGGRGQDVNDGQMVPGESRDGNDALGEVSHEEGLGGYNDEDTPLTWAEVDQEQFVVLDNRANPVVPGDPAAKVDEPVADPLGLKEVDLRIYQKTLVEDDSSAVVEVDGADGESFGTLQAKKRALLGQKDRLRLLKKMQSGKERVQRKMDRGRSAGKVGDTADDEEVSKTETKPSAREISRSVVPTTENFDPALFMTVVHATASFNDIRIGLGSLEGAKANQASELQHLVRDHFDSFVRCADSIEKYASHINMELTNNKEQPKEEPPARPKSLAQLRMQLKAEREAEGKSAHSSRGGGDSWASSGPAAKSHLKELTRLMEGARTEAGKNFSELLQKLENIKQVRAAQHLLSEKGSILDVPREMSACMADGRYTELVKLYRKAQTTYSSSILSQVRVEAEAVGKRACVRLMEVLRSPDVTLQEQIDAVGHLQDLQHDGDEPLQACFDSQKENFLQNAGECRDAMESLLQEAYAFRRANEKAERETRNRGRDQAPISNRSDSRRKNSIELAGKPLLQRIGSISEDMTDSEDFSPIGSLGGGGGSNRSRFFEFREDHILLAMDGSEDESLYESHLLLDDEGRSDAAAGRVQIGIPELSGMELDEDVSLPVPAGMDILAHRVSVARLQHVSNLAWCLGSWLPHLVSLAVFLIRLEHKKKGRNMDEIGGGASSPHVHIRKLCGPGAYGGGTSDYADGDTASVATSGPRASTSVQEGTSTRGSEDSFVTGRRDGVGTKAEKELTKLFERWLNSITSVLRAAIFGDDSASDQGSSGKKGSATAGLLGRKPNSSTVRGSPTGSNNDDDMLFAANKHGRLASIYANEPHLKQPLDPSYLRQAFSSLAHLYDSLSQALGGSWEGDVVLTPGLRALEKLVKEAQALHVRSEMAALATEARGLMDVESWLPPEPPLPPGGTRLPHMFGALAQQRMVDLVDLLPRAEWSAAEITHGLSDAVQCLLSCVTALGTHAYETSQDNPGAALTAGGGTGAPGLDEEGLSADHQLLCQIGNCLQLDDVILPQLWDAAVDMFDASRAGVISDRKRTKKVQEKVMNKYLKRKYRELKMYVKNGWWGYSKLATASGSAGDLQSLRKSDRTDSERDQRKLSTTITRQRASLRLNRGTRFAHSGGATAAAASLARQASVLSSKNDDGVKSGSKSGPEENARTGSALRRAGLSASLNVPIRTPKAQSLPSYLVKVLLSLVQARLEAQEALCGLLYRKAGMHDGKMRKDILYSDFVLRESARQVMEIVCDCANARVVGKGHLGAKVLDGSDPVEQAEKIAQAEFLRDALYRFLPSVTLERVNRVIKRLQAGKFEGTLGRSTAGPSTVQRADTQEGTSARDGLMRVGPARQGSAAALQATKQDSSGKSIARGSTSTSGGALAKPTTVSDSLGAAMPGSFLTATDLQELARVYVVCLK